MKHLAHSLKFAGVARYRNLSGRTTLPQCPFRHRRASPLASRNQHWHTQPKPSEENRNSLEHYQQRRSSLAAEHSFAGKHPNTCLPQELSNRRYSTRRRLLGRILGEAYRREAVRLSEDKRTGRGSDGPGNWGSARSTCISGVGRAKDPGPPGSFATPESKEALQAEVERLQLRRWPG